MLTRLWLYCWFAQQVPLKVCPQQCKHTQLCVSPSSSTIVKFKDWARPSLASEALVIKYTLNIIKKWIHYDQFPCCDVWVVLQNHAHGQPKQRRLRWPPFERSRVAALVRVHHNIKPTNHNMCDCAPKCANDHRLCNYLAYLRGQCCILKEKDMWYGWCAEVCWTRVGM